MKSVMRARVVVGCVISIAVLFACGGGSHQSIQPSIQPLTITVASLTNGTLETPYTQTIKSSGGVGPFTWTVSAGALPHGLSLNRSMASSITVSGTPDTVAQAVSFTIKITDSTNQSASKAYTISILPAPDTLTLAPSSLSFAPELIGSVSGAQAETVTNTGTSAIEISSIELTGTDAADFNQSGTCGSSLAPDANCTINVTFAPSQLGPVNASIAITDNTVGSPHSLSLNGVGVTSGLNATLSATSILFATQFVGTTSSWQSITLSNYGTATLNIAGIAVSADFRETDNCTGSTLASGTSCTVSVTFTPSAAGSVNGMLSVSDNAPGSPQTVSLSGMGVANNYTLTGGCVIQAGYRACTQASDPAQCPPGQTAMSPATLYGICYGPVTVDGARHCSSHGLWGVCRAISSGGAVFGAARP